MNTTQIRVLGGLLLLGLAQAASAGTYTFSQGSFIDGSFSGTDANSDGFLTKNELSEFTLHITSFTDGQFYTGFWHYLPQLQNFSLATDLSSITFHSQSGYNTFKTNGAKSTLTWTNSPLPNYTLVSQVNVTATGPVTTSVPETETYAMLLAGLGAIGFMQRRRRAK